MESSLEGVPRPLEDRLEQSELERFEAVVLPHLDAAYTLARYLTRNDQNAEDVAQEACLRAFKYIRGFRGNAGREGRAWLLAIVRNMAHTWLKRNRAEALATEFDEELHSDTSAGEPADAALERHSSQESLHRALNQLGPEFREVIVLRELEELSYKEISDVTGVPVGTVMSRLSRARRRLQDALGAEEEGR